MLRISFISLYDEYCLDLRYASAMLRRDGHQTYVNLFKGVCSIPDSLGDGDANGYSGARVGASEQEMAHLLQTLRRQNPDLAVLFFTSISYGLAGFITSLLKTELEIPIVWAGLDSTFNPVENGQQADILCIGETEYPIRFLAESIEKNQKYSNIHSLWTRNRSRIEKNPAMGLETNLDKLPWPDFDPQNTTVVSSDAVHADFCPSKSPLWSNVPILASRECPFTCPYCGTSHDGFIYAKSEGARLRSVDSVVGELKHRALTWPRPVERIEFHDRAFPLDPNWLAEFTERYPTEIALPFFGYTCANGAEPEAYRALRQAGMFALILRIPSGSPRILREVFRRNDAREQILHTARAISDSGIKLLCELTTSNPFESEEDRCETLELLNELPAGFGAVDHIPFAFYENCDLYRAAQEKNILGEFERLPGEHAWQAKPNPVHLFWDSIFKLAQFAGVDRSDLAEFTNDDYLRENPATLQEVVCNLYRTTYVNSNPMAEKDQFIQYLRDRLSETQKLAAQPAARTIQQIVQTIKSKR